MNQINVDIDRVKDTFRAYTDALAHANIVRAGVANFRPRPQLPIYINEDTQYNGIVDDVNSWELHYGMQQYTLYDTLSELYAFERSVINEMPVNQWVQFDDGTYLGVSDELLRLRIVTTPPTGAFPSS